MFKVNSKDTRETLMIRSGVFIGNFEHILSFLNVSIVDFEQVRVC